MAERFEEALGFDGGHAARACGGDCLAIAEVLDVAVVDDAFDVGAGTARGLVSHCEWLRGGDVTPGRVRCRDKRRFRKRRRR